MISHLISVPADIHNTHRVRWHTIGFDLLFLLFLAISSSTIYVYGFCGPGVIISEHWVLLGICISSWPGGLHSHHLLNIIYAHINFIPPNVYDIGTR